MQGSFIVSGRHVAAIIYTSDLFSWHHRQIKGSLFPSLSLSLSLCASHAHTPHGQGPSTRAWRIASGCVPGRWALHFPPHSHREANEHVIKQTIVASSWCILEHLAADRSFGRFSLWTAKLARASASHCSESNSADCCGLLPSQPQSMVVAEQAKRRGGWQLSPVGLARNLVGDVFFGSSRETRGNRDASTPAVVLWGRWSAAARLSCKSPRNIDWCRCHACVHPLGSSGNTLWGELPMERIWRED